MNFFQHQQLARRHTRVMVILFLIAVVAVIAAVDAVVGAVYVWSFAEFAAPAGRRPGMLALLAKVPSEVYAWGAICTAALIFLVSLINMARLGGGGGAAVARMAGARQIAPGTRDPLERRLLNVAEEMAIASGVRVPGVYVMEGESAINAFAAGWDLSGAVVAVTRGALEKLTRDELQGVLAHEFSHILNGDMRLNIRMLGVLAGIVFIGSAGEFVMRMRSRDSRGAGIVLAGLALFVIGYIGLFFARLIKAAVSRQREFLADASSVQFTRNPLGIAGALDQIRASGAGTLIAGRYAEEMSHLFFGQSVRLRLGALLDTHPPIEKRIARVHPGFDADGYRRGRNAAQGGQTASQPQPGEGAPAASTGRRAGDTAAPWTRSAADSANLVGTLDAGKKDFAARLLVTLPPPLREALREPRGAAAAMIALLLARKDEAMQQQVRALSAAVGDALAERILATVPLTRGLGPGFHLPVIDLALPAVKAAAPAEKKELIAGIEAVIYADRRVSLHEYVVLALVREQLAQARKPVGSRNLKALQAEAATLLALIAHAGTRVDATGERKEALQAALRAGAREMGLDEKLPAAARLALEPANAALEALKELAPLQKALLVKGLFAAATSDGTILVAEAELLRLVGAVLDCPLPPLLDEIDPASFAV